MKRRKKKKTHNSLFGFLKPILGNKTKEAIRRLNAHRIEQVEQLAGVAQICMSKLSNKEAKQKGVAAGFLLAQNSRKADAPIRRLQRLLKISVEEAQKIALACESVPEDHQRYYFDSGWALGAVKHSVRNKGNVLRAVPKKNFEPGFFVIPQYQDAGSVYDQGNRGTCVANATCTLLNYKSGRRLSRQFHYHQCKMVDRMLHLEGTTLEAAFRVLSDHSLADKGNVDESIWPYNPHPRKTEHQGPPPEDAFSTERVIALDHPVFIGSDDKVNAIKYLLNYQVNGKGCPVVIGIPLYESFFSWSTAETGWVTIPIPGEAIVGHHAMVVVGYDDDRRLFLVRNSWGPHWAHMNDKEFNGHAWIPFEYISRFCDTGATLTDINVKRMRISENDRLYFRKTQNLRRGKTAATRSSKSKALLGKGRQITFSGWLVRAAIVILLWMAYKEQILSFKDRVVSTFKENVELSALRDTAAEKLDELNN